MAKREIRINYDGLEKCETNIRKYHRRLEDLGDALKKVNDLVVENSRADSIEKLEKRYKKVKKNLDVCMEESNEVYKLIRDYRVAMTNIIKSKGGMTKVGRNEVYWNLKSIYNAFEDIENIKNSHFLYSESEVGLTDTEKQAMQRNYNKMYNKIWEDVFKNLENEVYIRRKKIKDYYDNEITEYENKDDEYKKRSEKIRFHYSSPFEVLKQSEIDNAKSFWKVIKGAAMAVVDLVKGLFSIGNMLYYGVSSDVAAIAYLVCPETPEWASDALDESEDYFGNIAHVLSHPVEAVESLAQNVNDTYEKEGLTYMVSYTVADFLLGKALGGAGKADDVTDVARVTNKADDVIDVASVANKADDVASVANKANDVKIVHKEYVDMPFDETGKLKANVKYKAGEHNYNYETDTNGRISNWNTEKLQMTERKKRLKHNANTPGKEEGDHAGHLAGDRFGGSPNLDNIVSQSKNVNLSKYKKIENEWEKAIKEGKKVTVNVNVKYAGDGLRPTEFIVEYTIDGKYYSKKIMN